MGDQKEGQSFEVVFFFFWFRGNIEKGNETIPLGYATKDANLFDVEKNFNFTLFNKIQISISQIIYMCERIWINITFPILAFRLKIRKTKSGKPTDNI